MTDEPKACTRCGNEWPRTAFSPDRRTKDGLHSWCKPCMNEENKARYRRRLADDPEETRRKARDYVARHRAEHGDERNKALARARWAALRRLAGACPAEFSAIYDRARREHGLELRR